MSTTKAENGYSIGDYVYTHAGKIRKITGDDMPDLKYEDIARKATEEEDPSFEFNLKWGSNSDDRWTRLTKENFFNPFMKKCPFAVKSFCEWIDIYKHQTGWNDLFGPKVKFHHIRWEMQFGILVEFISWKLADNGLELRGDWQEPEQLVKAIITDFIDLELKFRNGEI